MHGNDLGGERGEITSPLFPHMYDIETGSEEVSKFRSRNLFRLQSEFEGGKFEILQVITWRVTVADGMSIFIRFTVFEIESSHWDNDQTCNSKIQVEKEPVHKQKDVFLFCNLWKLSEVRIAEFTQASYVLNCHSWRVFPPPLSGTSIAIRILGGYSELRVYSELARAFSRCSRNKSRYDLFPWNIGLPSQ